MFQNISKYKYKNFSRAAKVYAQNSLLQNDVAKILLEKIEKNLDLSTAKFILDIGCGPGNYTNFLADKISKTKNSSQIFAFDISPEMIAAAKAQNKFANVNYFVGDGENIFSENFASEILSKKFDLITSNATFQWFTNFSKIMDDYADLMLDNSWLFLSIFGPKTFCELAQVLRESNLGFFENGQNIAAEKFRDKQFYDENFAFSKNKKFSKINISEIFLKSTYPDLPALLKNIKNTGTQGGNFNINKIWTRGNLKKLEQIYLQKFGKIEATYHVIFIEAKK